MKRIELLNLIRFIKSVKLNCCSVVRGYVVSGGEMMHGDLVVNRETVRRSKHDWSRICGRGELLRIHVGVGVARAHHYLLSGVLLDVDNERGVVVHLLIVFVVVAALLEDLDAIDDTPDVDTNVDERHEQEYELSDGSAPSGPTALVNGASIDEAANGWEEDVEKQCG